MLHVLLGALHVSQYVRLAVVSVCVLSKLRAFKMHSAVGTGDSEARFRKPCSPSTLALDGLEWSSAHSPPSISLLNLSLFSFYINHLNKT